MKLISLSLTLLVCLYFGVRYLLFAKRVQAGVIRWFEPGKKYLFLSERFIRSGGYPVFLRVMGLFALLMAAALVYLLVRASEFHHTDVFSLLSKD